MMKKRALVFLLLFGSFSGGGVSRAQNAAGAAQNVVGQPQNAIGQPPNNVTITASLNGLDSGQWAYWYSMGHSERVDSVKTTPGGFQIALQIPAGEGDGYILRIGKAYVENSLIFFYIDKGNVTIKGNGPMFKNVAVSGGPAILDYNADQTIERPAPEEGFPGVRRAGTPVKRA
jgi:hypothetical protein